MGSQTPFWILHFMAAYEPYLKNMQNTSSRRYKESSEQKRKAAEESAFRVEQAEDMWNRLGKRNDRALDKLYYRKIKRAIRMTGTLVGGLPS